MKTSFKILVPVVIFLAVSCKKESDTSQSTPTTQPQLKVDSTTLNISGTKNDVDSFTVQFSGDWAIRIAPTTATWLKTSASSGTGNTKIYVTTEQDNTSGVAQTASIVVTPDGDATKEVSIAVTQNLHTTRISALWSKLYGGTGDDFFTSVIQTADGGYISVGTNASSDGDVSANKGKRDVWVVKVDANGNKVWEKSYGGSNIEDGASIATTSDGNYVIAAYTSSNDDDISGSHGYNDLFVFKIDESGNVLWKKTIGGTSYEFTSGLNYITSTTDGGCIIATSTLSNDGDVSGNHGDEDIWVVKLDQSGSIVWQKAFGGTYMDEADAITASPDGGAIITGLTQSNNGDVSGNHQVGTYDVWVLKIDANGNKVWQTALGGTDLDYGHAITTTTDGGYIIAGKVVSNDGDVSGNHGQSDAWVVKIDGNGSKVWQKTFGGSGNDGASSIIKVNGGYIVAAQTQSTDGDVLPTNGTIGAWIFQIDESGNFLWQHNFGGTNGGTGIVVIPTTDGNYIVGGSTSSNDGDVSGNHGKSDAWIFKLAAK